VETTDIVTVYVSFSGGRIEIQAAEIKLTEKNRQNYEED
jgi:hypothetical protein